MVRSQVALVEYQKRTKWLAESYRWYNLSLSLSFSLQLNSQFDFRGISFCFFHILSSYFSFFLFSQISIYIDGVGSYCVQTFFHFIVYHNTIIIVSCAVFVLIFFSISFILLYYLLFLLLFLFLLCRPFYSSCFFYFYLLLCLWVLTFTILFHWILLSTR